MFPLLYKIRVKLFLMSNLDIKPKCPKTLLIFVVLVLIVLIFYFTKPFLLDKPDNTNSKNKTSQKRLIVLISIDGLGSNLINENTPFLYSLLEQQNVSYTLEMQTLEQSESIPSHVSMVTGLKQENHEFYLNSVSNDISPIEEKTIFDYAIENGYTFSVFLTKDKLLYLLGEKFGENIVSMEEYSSKVMSEIDQLVEPVNSKILIFLHFKDVDSYGHMYGWNSSKQQIASSTLDQNLELLIKDIRREFQNYERFFILTSDHGGEGTQHSDGCTICRRIPLVIISENNESNYILNKSSYNIYDIACIVLDLMENTKPQNIDCYL